MYGDRFRAGDGRCGGLEEELWRGRRRLEDHEYHLLFGRTLGQVDLSLPGKLNMKRCFFISFDPLMSRPDDPKFRAKPKSTMTLSA